MTDLKTLEVWFVTGSQHLYGEETLKQVAAHSQTIAAALNKSAAIPVKVVFKPTLKTPDEIFSLCKEANNNIKLYWHYCMDAYFLSGKNVDQWIEDPSKTHAAFAYTI